jgi:hypothetical protein
MAAPSDLIRSLKIEYSNGLVTLSIQAIVIRLELAIPAGSV